MADIKLVRPSAGQTAVIPSAPDARMVLDFSADQVSIERPQGSDSLFFRFDDGAAIELQNFYTQYNKDDIPSFEVDGQLIAGADFFNAFGPDLAPAAGPSASPTRSGRYSDFANAGLEDGVNHLDGLDYRLGFGGDTQPNINPYASPFLTNAAPSLSTGGAAIAIGLTESAWDGKSASAAPVVSQSGSFSVADPDGDSLTTTVNMGGKVVAVSTAGPTTVESDYGTLVITPKGGGSNVTFEYTYTLKQDPYSPTDSLAEGEKQADNIVFSISDGQGHTVTQPINVVITGSNDAPDITGVTDLTLKDIGDGNGVNVKGERSDTLNADENKPTQNGGTDFTQHTLSASGQIVARDPDHGDELTYGIKSVLIDNASVTVTGHATSVAGFDTAYDMDGYGTLYLNSKTGDYRFDLDSTEKSTVDKLSEGDSVKISMVPTVHDKLGASDNDSGTTREAGRALGGETIDITIHGTNEAPENMTAQWTGGNTVQEDVTPFTISGAVKATDRDSDGADLRYGLVHTDADGKQHSETKLYVVDDNGTMKITTVAPTDGTGGHHDGYYGVLTMDPKSGEYSFTMYNDSNVVQGMGLKADGTPESKSLLGITLVAEDAHGAYTTSDISLTVNGTNDAPVFSATKYTASVTESGVQDHGNASEPGVPFSVVGRVDSHDADLHDKTPEYSIDGGTKLATAATVGGETYDYSKTTDYGTLYLNSSSGKYVFRIDGTKDGVVDKMASGDSKILNFGITVNDDHHGTGASTIEVTIHGTNDQPTLAALTSLAVKEDITLSTSGNLVISHDADASDTHSFAIVDKSVGESYNSTNGSYTVAESGSSTISYATPSSSNIMQGRFGKMEIGLGADKKPIYTYTLDNSKGDVQQLGLNADGTPETLSETFYIMGKDDKGGFDIKPVTITIAGTNDAPVFSATKYTASVTESGVRNLGNDSEPGVPLSVAGQVNSQDADLHDKTPTYSIDGVTKLATATTVGSETYDYSKTTDYGTLYLNSSSGKYVFKIDDTKGGLVDKMDFNDAKILNFGITVNDDHHGTGASTIEVTIHGTNDQPTLKFVTKDSHGDAVVVNSGDLSVVEAGAGVVHTSVSASVLGADVDAHAATSFGLVVGHKDVADIGGRNLAFDKDSAGQSGLGAGHTTVDGTYGTLSIDASGKYTYSLDESKANFLDSGEERQENFTIYVRDEHGAWDSKQITVAVHGANDAPVFDSKYSNSVKETGYYEKDDRGKKLVSAENTKNTTDSNADAANGSTASANHELVVSGELHATDVDGVAGSASLKDTLTFGIKAINSSNKTVDLYATGHEITVNVLAPTSETLSSKNYRIVAEGVSIKDYEKCGTLVLHEDGKYTFTLTESEVVNRLSEGEKVTIAFKPLVTDSNNIVDGHPQNTADGGTYAVTTGTITVSVKGSNEVPTITSNAWDKSVGLVTVGGSEYGIVTEDSTTSITGNIAGKDTDTSDNLSYHLVASATDGAKLNTVMYVKADGTLVDEATFNKGSIDDFLGEISIESSGGNAGTYTFKLYQSSAAVQKLSGNDIKNLDIPVVVVDNHGAYKSGTINVQIQGSYDAIRVTSNDAHSIQAWESGVARVGSDPNASFEKSTEYDGSQATGGTFKVIQVDANTDKLQYGFKVTLDGGIVKYIKDSYDTGYGKLTIDRYGKFSFELDQDASAVKTLNAGDLTKITNIELAAWDTRQGTTSGNTFTPPKDLPPATQKLELYIKGTNDKPDFTFNTENSASRTITFKSGLTEDNSKFSTSTGQLSGTDVDAADTPATLRYSLVYGSGTTQVLEGKYGVVELKPDGSYTYTLTKPDLLQHLDDNTHLKDEVFTVRIQDQRGAYSNATLQIDITGKKDAPIVNISGNSIKEDAGHTVYPGSVDHSDDPTTTGQLTLGKIVDDSDKASFGQDGAKAGWTVDSSTSTDIQVVKAYADGISGATVAKGNYGYLVVSPNGSYKYFLTENDNEAIQKLNEGNSLNETFTVVATAGGSTVPQSISIAIHGTNDRPYFTSSTPAFAGAAKVGNFEDQANDWVDTAHPGTVFVGTVTGKADVDDPTNSLVYKFAVSHTDGSTSYATEVKTDYGTISIDPATGKYTYFLDTYSAKLAKALNHSNAGIDDSVKVVIIDPHAAVSEPKDITIHITPGSSGSGGSGGSDWRNPSYTFSQLERAVKEDDGFDLHVGSKEHPSPEGVAVTGHLDAIWGVSYLSINAPDYGFGINDGHGNQVQGMEGKYGYLSVNPATGAYTYTLYNTRPDVQALREGDTVEETFSMMFNGKPWTEGLGLFPVNLVINVNGTNDSPVVDSYKDIDLAEKDHFASQATYRIVGSDADAGETAMLKYSIDGDHGHNGKVAGKFGTFTLNSDGKYSYKANEGLNLNEGVTETDSFTVLVTDAHGATTQQVLKVNLTGANDAPTVKFDSGVDHTGNTVQASITEDTHTSLTGNAKTFFEDDEGDSNLTFSAKSVSSNTAGMVVRGEYGVLVVKPDGSYSYVLNNSDSKVQGLDSKTPNITETFTIIATDKHGASNEVTLKVNVSGTDDLPEVTVEKVLTVTEGSPANSMSGTITVFDADSADVAKSPNLYFEAADKPAHDNISNEYGTFTVKPSGEYTFTLNNSSPAVMALKAGQLVETHATLVVEDQNHNKVTQLITVNIKGSASGPVVENATDSDFDVSAVANPDAGLKYIAQGKVVGTDYEDHEVSYTVKTQGVHGTLGITANGSYTYTVDAHDKAVLALGDGNSLADTVMISVIAKNGQVTDHSIKFTIHGTNDAPVATSETFGTANGQLHATDPDTGDHIASYALQTDAAYGHVTVTADGQYTYDPNIHSEQGLDALQLHLSGSGDTWASSFTDSFMFTATDNHALTSAAGKASLAFDVTEKDGGHHVDITTGGETSHLLFGSNSADNLDARGETQNHILYGGGGDDTLYGGAGDDILYGGAGRNELYGGDGNDTLYAGNAGDHLYGGAGNDHLYGGADSDFLDGGANTFATDGGGNHLYGGAGNDVLVFHQGDTIDGGSGTDVLLVKGGSVDALFDSDGKLNSNITNSEILISGKENGTVESLTDVGKLSDIGMTVGSDGKVTTANTSNATWADSGTHGDYNVMTCTITHTDSSSEEVTVAVLKTTLNNG